MDLIFEIVKGHHSNWDAVHNGVRYIFNGAVELDEKNRFVGCQGIPEGSSTEEVIMWMTKTKQVFGLEWGTQCKHLVVSFGEKSKIKSKKLKKTIRRIVGFWKNRYQVYWGVHYNLKETGPNFHLHILLNNVDLKTGNRLNLTNKLWRQFKVETTKTWEKALKSGENSKTRG